jgi:predicted transcriptional regulator
MNNINCSLKNKNIFKLSFGKILVICRSLINNSQISLNNTLENKIPTYFEDAKSLSREELLKAILTDFPDWKESTINVYLSKLKKRGIIKNPSRGVYCLKNRTIFKPSIDINLKKIFNKIKQDFPYINFCVWNTKWLNDVMRHQPFKQYQIIEVEKDAAEQVFNTLSIKEKNVFLNPNAEIFERYINNVDKAVIIKYLVSEAPLNNVDNIVIPTLEKLLVDVLVDVAIFSAQQDEIEFIYNTAFSKFQINSNKMKRYAIRRNRLSKLEELINLTLAKL